jgi:hypothetical protein
MGTHTIRLTVRVVLHTKKHQPGAPGGGVLACRRPAHGKPHTGFYVPTSRRLMEPTYDGNYVLAIFSGFQRFSSATTL